MTEHKSLPLLTPLNTFFWTGGKTGRLLMLRCYDCKFWLHPPAPNCPRCMSRDVEPQQTSGLGVVEAFTVNHQAWTAGLTEPYVIAVVSLADCPDVRLTTNLVGVATDDVRIGMAVRCTFEQHDDVWLPLFTPA
ncbi:hypothetical protein BH09PSE5_BH09PSE5_23510 [soil metagenome]